MLKLNVGFTKKVGEANYGSRGASVNVELEYDSAMASDPERLKERIRFLFGLAKASVEEELNGQAAPANNGHSSNGNGHRRSNGRRATASQVRALHAIADRQHLDLANVLQDPRWVASSISRRRHGFPRPDRSSSAPTSTWYCRQSNHRKLGWQPTALARRGSRPAGYRRRTTASSMGSASRLIVRIVCVAAMLYSGLSNGNSLAKSNAVAMSMAGVFRVNHPHIGVSR